MRWSSISPFRLVLLAIMSSIIVSFWLTTLYFTSNPQRHPFPPHRLHSYNSTQLMLRHLSEPRRAVVIKMNFSAALEFSSSLDLDMKNETSMWLATLQRKLHCFQAGQVAIFHYHTRKAAGTTLKWWITQFRSLGFFYSMEAEGIAVDRAALAHRGILSLTSFRDPIDRIISLYWYEHVEWYVTKKQEVDKVSSLIDWVEAWRDGSVWKNLFLLRNPNSLYVEIENYYVKMLVNKTSRVTREDLAEAQRVLRSFDVIVITEWIQDTSTQMIALDKIFRFPNGVSTVQRLRGNASVRSKLASALSPDEEKVREKLARMNALDIELYQYAMALAASRYDSVKGRSADDLRVRPREFSRREKREAFNFDGECGDRHFLASYARVHKDSIGVFRPPNHKGPVNGF